MKKQSILHIIDGVIIAIYIPLFIYTAKYNSQVIKEWQLSLLMLPLFYIIFRFIMYGRVLSIYLQTTGVPGANIGKYLAYVFGGLSIILLLIIIINIII